MLKQHNSKSLSYAVWIFWGLFIGLAAMVLLSGWFLSSKPPNLIYDYAAFSLITFILGILMALDFLYTNKRLEFKAHQETEHHGISGFRRSIMGIGFILIFCWIVFRLLMHYITTVKADGSKDIIQNAIGIIEGILASLTGFYFGVRATPTNTNRFKYSKDEDN